jgi:hypothetical protein
MHRQDQVGPARPSFNACSNRLRSHPTERRRPHLRLISATRRHLLRRPLTHLTNPLTASPLSRATPRSPPIKLRNPMRRRHSTQVRLQRHKRMLQFRRRPSTQVHLLPHHMAMHQPSTRVRRLRTTTRSRPTSGHRHRSAVHQRRAGLVSRHRPASSTTAHRSKGRHQHNMVAYRLSRGMETSSRHSRNHHGRGGSSIESRLGALMH